MTSNIGQSLMGAGVMPPALAQDIASGNFHDNRESFHDYIYSKLILGEDNEGATTNSPVFPPSGLPSYASSMGPPPPRSSANFNSNQNQNLSNMSSSAVSSNNLQTASEPTLDMSNAQIPSSPQVSTLKPSNSKKSSHKSHHKNQLSNVTQINIPNHEGLMAGPKPKKNKSPKKKEKTNFCDVCGRGFAEKYTLNRHMMTHTHVKPYSCTKCNMAFSRSDGLQKHMNAGHRRIDAHHCDVCGGTFNSELSFEQHKREYGSTLPFVCNLCMLAFSQCCHLNYHMKSHSLKSDYGVEVNESQVEPINIDELVPEDFAVPKSKENVNKFNNINFSAINASLNPDIRIKHEIDDHYPYGKSGDLLQAEKKNGGDCTPSGNPSQPNASTSTSTDTTSTTNAISDLDMKKYYDIKIPNPRFMDSSNTNNNASGDGTTQSTEITLFRCHICGKGFTRKYHMQRHVRLHTRGPIPRAHLLDWTRRPYACGVCKMGFTRQHHLTRHMLIHTGERPHSCHVCGKAFRRFTNLSLHVRTVHGSERPFKCPICGRGFPRVYSLQRHLNTHSKNNDATLLMNAGLMPLPKKDAENTEPKSDGSPDYIAIGSKVMNSGNAGTNSHTGSGLHSDALLSDGSDEEVSHNHSRERQSEIDRINASIESTIGDVIKGAMAQGKPTKAKSKKSAQQSHQSSSQPNISSGVNSTMQTDQMVSLSLQQQHNEALQQQQQHQQQQQQQQLQQQQSQQQQQQQQQHSRHTSISQDSDQYSSQSSNMSNQMTRHDMMPQRPGYHDLSMRSPTPYSQHQQQPQHHQQSNGDRSTTPFSLNQPQHQQPQQLDARSSSSYNMHHITVDKSSTLFSHNQNAIGRDRPNSAFSLNSGGQAVSGDRSSTPYSHTQQPNMDRSSTPFMLNQPSNLDNFSSSSSSRSQNQQIGGTSIALDRSESRDPIIYSHSSNGFQIPMGTMDLSTQRNRLSNPPTIRQAPTDFGHNLTMSQAALNLNEAAAFAHVQATNNLSLFPGNATLTYHQQQLMGEALSRLDMELQAAHQGGSQLPATSHNSNRPY